MHNISKLKKFSTEENFKMNDMKTRFLKQGSSAQLHFLGKSPISQVRFEQFFVAFCMFFKL